MEKVLMGKALMGEVLMGEVLGARPGGINEKQSSPPFDFSPTRAGPVSP